MQSDLKFNKYNKRTDKINRSVVQNGEVVLLN